MASTIPKPAEQRRRTNKTVPTSNLRADGRDDKPPDPIEELDTLEREYYDWAWSTPSAFAWHDCDAELVAEWARLKAYATRCLRGEITRQVSSGSMIVADLSSGMLGQITTREDRLLLSPVARAKGYAKIVEPEPEHDGNVVKPGRWSA